MARLIRRPYARVTRDLDSRQRQAIMMPVDFPEPSPFSSVAEMRDAWERCRAELLGKCEPFTRPDAYWVFDVPQQLLGGVDPCCPRNGYESERAALLRLQLPLTEREKEIVGSETCALPGDAV